ncbi:hypothetical protein GGF50DRAFT_49271 [Schizophyllum commune]
MALQVDLVITFKTSSNAKRVTKEDVRQAEEQYARLIKTLKKAGLLAVGRRGESLGDLLVFVKCPEQLLNSLVRRERHSDFLSGLPTNPTSAASDASHLCPADRIRIVHAYIASSQVDGGLGINPGVPEWSKVDSIMTLHDPEFNEMWISSWTKQKVDDAAIESLRQQVRHGSYPAARVVLTIFASFSSASRSPCILLFCKHIVTRWSNPLLWE